MQFNDKVDDSQVIMTPLSSYLSMEDHLHLVSISVYKKTGCNKATHADGGPRSRYRI